MWVRDMYRVVISVKQVVVCNRVLKNKSEYFDILFTEYVTLDKKKYISEFHLTN